MVVIGWWRNVTIGRSKPSWAASSGYFDLNAHDSTGPSPLHDRSPVVRSYAYQQGATIPATEDACDRNVISKRKNVGDFTTLAHPEESTTDEFGHPDRPLGIEADAIWRGPRGIFEWCDGCERSPISESAIIV